MNSSLPRRLLTAPVWQLIALLWAIGSFTPVLADPMQPASAAPRATENRAAQQWWLEGIVSRAGQRRAKINAMWLKPGDSVDGAKLVSIGLGQVVLETDTGERRTIELVPGPARGTVKTNSRESRQ